MAAVSLGDAMIGVRRPAEEVCVDECVCATMVSAASFVVTRRYVSILFKQASEL